MHFSGKISNAILSYLESRGEDLSPLYDLSPVDLEILEDSSAWIPAPTMELFLEKLSHYSSQSVQDLVTLAGHEGYRLRPWGVLDSVLRMMPRPQEAFQQPARFLSYFISPEPPIENIQRTDSKIEFDLPLLAEQYPLVTCYLRSAFEGLPRYVGQNLAVCHWVDIHLKIEWPQVSVEIFEPTEDHRISPQLLQNVVEELQKSQKELEEKNRELQEKNLELQEMQKGLPNPLNAEESRHQLEGYLSHLHLKKDIPEERTQLVAQNLARLHDYMVRAQQIITILSVEAKNPQRVKQLTKKLDWDYVKAQYPRAIAESVEMLRDFQKTSIKQEKHNQLELQPMNLAELSAHDPGKDASYV